MKALVGYVPIKKELIRVGDIIALVEHVPSEGDEGGMFTEHYRVYVDRHVKSIDTAPNWEGIMETEIVNTNPMGTDEGSEYFSNEQLQWFIKLPRNYVRSIGQRT